MSLDKAIVSGKEKRQPYRKSKANSKGCRNHESCEHCLRNRTVSKARVAADAKLRQE